MLNWLIKHKEAVFLGLFCLVFFCIYAHFNLLTIKPSGAVDNPKFSSPDETANYFWIRQFAAGQPLYYFEELNSVGNNLIHPRSVNVIDGKNAPGSFLGLIFIYGSLAKIFSLGIVPYLTPFFSALGVFFFYLLLEKIFQSRPIAVISASLLAFSPAWFYYSCRGMYHNVFFASLLIIGLYFLWKVLANRSCNNFQFLPLRGISQRGTISPPTEDLPKGDNFSANLSVNNYASDEGGSLREGQINSKFKIQNSKFFFYLLSGLLVGFALITRTSEIVWVALTVLLILILNFKKIHWPGFVLFLAAGFVPFVVLFYYNQILYGAFVSAGYRVINDVFASGGLASAGVLFQILITPFGIDPRSIFINGFSYLYQLFPIWSSLAFIGAFLFAILPTAIIKLNYKKRFVYLAYCFLSAVYLLIFYGSWSITDRIDQQTLSLGTSYLRYWLPIYVISLPFIAVLFWHIAKLLIPHTFNSRQLLSVLISAGFITLLAMPTFNLVYCQTDESLFLLKNLVETRDKSALINNLIGPDDVVIVYKQADKIFFPERKKIITDLVVPADYAAVKNLVQIRNVYYYTYAPASTVAFISRRDFEPLGMALTAGQKVFGTDWLYKIVIRNP